MTCSLRLDLLIAIGSTGCKLHLGPTLGAWSRSTADHLWPHGCSTSDNHADIHSIILVWHIETARGHGINIGVDRQILWQHILLLNNYLFIIELNRRCLKWSLLRQYRWLPLLHQLVLRQNRGQVLLQDGRLRRPAILNSTSVASIYSWASTSLPERLGVRWVHQRALLVNQLLVVLSISICVKLCKVVMTTLAESILLVFTTMSWSKWDNILRRLLLPTRCYLRLVM